MAYMEERNGIVSPEPIWVTSGPHSLIKLFERRKSYHYVNSINTEKFKVSEQYNNVIWAIRVESWISTLNGCLDQPSIQWEITNRE